CAFSRLSSSLPSSAASFERSSLAFIVYSLSTDVTRDERGRDRQLGGSQAERLACEFFADAFHFVEHLAGLDFGDPVFGVALAVTHPDFGRLLRDRLIREN